MKRISTVFRLAAPGWCVLFICGCARPIDSTIHEEPGDSPTAQGNDPVGGFLDPFSFTTISGDPLAWNARSKTLQAPPGEVRPRCLAIHVFQPDCNACQDQAKALQNFDPYPIVLKAAGYLIHHGPVTPQERWEENSGYSPSTLAAQIAALICAAAFARERGHQATARYLEEYADFLDAHLEPWTVTTDGSKSGTTG